MNSTNSEGDIWQEDYAISTILFSQNSLDQALPKIASAGFKWIEAWADQCHFEPRINPDLQTAKSLIGELGLRVHSIHTPFRDLKLGHPNPGLKENWLRVIGASLQAGAELEAEIAVVHVNSDIDELDDRLFEESREITIEFIEALNQQAMSLGIQLALENLPVMPHQTRRFGWSLKELNEAFPSQDIGFCLDVGHAIVNGLDICSEIRAAGERLLSVHADSNDGVTDLHWPLDEGVLHWLEVIDELVRSGYKGRYVLEILSNMESDDPDTVLRQATDFTKKKAE